MAKAIHTMIRVLDEARALDFYKRALGLEVAGRFEFDTFVLIYLAGPESGYEIELTVNKGRTEPYGPGEAYGHLGFTVEDIAAEHARLTQEGFAPLPLREMLHEGRLLARIFFLEDPDGHKIEILQRAGRFR